MNENIELFYSQSSIKVVKRVWWRSFGVEILVSVLKKLTCYWKIEKFCYLPKERERGLRNIDIIVSLF